MSFCEGIKHNNYYSIVAMVTDMWCHLTYNSVRAWHTVYTMLLPIKNLNLPEIHTVQNLDFLKSLIHAQIIEFSIINHIKRRLFNSASALELLRVSPGPNSIQSSRKCPAKEQET